MRTSPSCFPCMIRQAVQALELFSDDERRMEYVCREVARHISSMDLSTPPPLVAQFTHRVIREVLGCADPYKALKEEANRMALELLPELEKQVQNSLNPLESAIRYAAAGNMFDLSVFRSVSREKILETLESAMTQKLAGLDVAEFERNLENADDILYITDNAGEIVFDRLLLARLNQIAPVTIVVKGSPVVNDATREDAQHAGLEVFGRIIDTGTDIPGTVLNQCGEDFQTKFWEADVVLAKGQANYETLYPPVRDIFYLFMVKCSAVSRQVGMPLGTMMFFKGVRGQGAEIS